MAKGSISAKENHSMSGSKCEKNEIIWNSRASSDKVSKYKKQKWTKLCKINRQTHNHSERFLTPFS